MKQSWAMGWAKGAVLLAVIGMGCGGDDDSSKGGSTKPPGSAMQSPRTPCSTGVSVICTNRSTLCQGIQLCGSDGFLGPCNCDDNTTPGMPGANDAGNGAPDGAVGSDAGMNKPPPGKPDRDAGTKPPPVPGKDSGTQSPSTDEDCGNGIDDDGDGDPDCADSDCAARACVGAAPSGWTGPSVVYVGGNPPNCGGDYATATLSGGTAVDAAPADCSSCSCTNTNAACASIVNIVSTTDPQCDGTSCVDSIGEQCKTLNSSCFGSATTAFVSMQLPQGLPSCSPTADQNPSVGDASWNKEVRACTASAKLHIGGCALGEVCAPKTPFSGDICVSKAGDVACPNGSYSQKHVYYKGVNDTRSCSPCGCDHDCGYTWRVDAAGASCTAPFSLDETDACVMVSPSSGAINVGVQVTGTGACNATGGMPTGDAVETGAVTVCCQP